MVKIIDISSKGRAKREDEEFLDKLKTIATVGDPNKMKLVIGWGAYGIEYTAIETATGREVPIKQIYLRKQEYSFVPKELINEIVPEIKERNKQSPIFQDFLDSCPETKVDKRPSAELLRH